MDRREELAAAAARVRRGEVLVEWQREIVARLTANGLEADVARTLLERLETSLSTMRDHRDLIHREAEEEASAVAWRRRGGARTNPH